MTQLDKLRMVMDDMKPHRSDELLELVYGSAHLGLARLGARVYDLRRSLPPGHEIKSWRDKKRPTLTWYQQTVVVEQTDLFEVA